MPLDLRLKAYQPNGVSRGILPAPDGFTLALPVNDTPSLALNYGVAGPRSGLLGQPVELAVEVSGDGGQTWTEPDDCRFLYLRDGRDPIKTADTWQAEAPGYLWRLQKARVLDEGKAVGGRRVFDAVTPGQILATFWTEAKVRGALTGMTLQGDASVDAAGVAWGTALSRDYDLGADYLQVLMDLAAGGWLDFRMTARTLKLYRPDTVLATDRTVGDAQVQLTPLVVTEAPFRRTWEGLADFIQVAGDEGASVGVTNGAALKPWGRWEDFITQGGVSDAGTLTAMGQRYQTLTAAERAEFTQAMALGGDGPRPLVDFMPGDYIWSRDLAGVRSRYRVRQVTLQKEGNAVTGNVVLNDRFLEADIRTRRALDALTGGAGSGSTGGTPTLPGPDILQPASITTAPLWSSAAYLDNTGKTLGQITLDWADVTTNRDGTPITDLAYYLVQTKPGAPTGSGEWREMTRTDSATSKLTASPYEPGSVWSFRVKAVDNSGNEAQDWSPAAQVTVSADTTGPVKPSQPTGTSRLGMARVAWNGTSATASSMDADFAFIAVHLDVTAAFTPSPANRVGELTDVGYVVAGPLAYGATYYAKLVPYDSSGNEGTVSDASAAIVVAPLVDVSNFPDDAMETLYARTGHFIRVDADMMEANSVRTIALEAGAVTAQKLSIADLSDAAFPMDQWPGAAVDATGAFFVVNGNGSGNTHFAPPGGNWWPVSAGDKWVFSWDAYMNYAGYTGSGAGYVQFYKGDRATLVSDVSLATVSQGKADYATTSQGFTIPSGAEFARLFPYVTASARMAVRAISLRRQVPDAEITDISPGKIKTGMVQATTRIVAGASLTGARAELNSVGFQTFNATGVKTFEARGSDGAVTVNLLTGSTFRTNTGADDILITPGSTTVPASLQFLSDGAQYDPATPAQVSCWDYLGNSSNGVASNNVRVRLQGAMMKGYTVQPRIDITNSRYNDGTGLVATIDFHAGHAGTGGPGSHTFWINGLYIGQVDATGFSTEKKLYAGSTAGDAIYTLGGAKAMGAVEASGGLFDLSLIGGGSTGASINTNGRIVRTSSSERLKKYIHPLTLEEAQVALDLQAVTFQWRAAMDMGDRRIPGFLAEQAHDAGAGLWVTYDKDNPEDLPNGFRYPELTAAHNVLIQNLWDRVAALEARSLANVAQPTARKS